MAFAVIDLETTGVMPEMHDRVVEVGVVLVDDGGRLDHEWTTLVNPRRDVGATHIHGLRAADLLDAPEFDEIANSLLDLVAGRTVVAHNATFDMRFLHSELARARYAIAGEPPALCSMKWSGRFIGPAKLHHACEALGVPLNGAHSALGDARATAGLLTHLLLRGRNNREWSEDADRSRTFVWPARHARKSAKAIARGDQNNDPRSWLQTVLNAAWIPGVPKDEAAYLLVLDRALLDRQISCTEGRQLIDAAKRAGLNGASVARLHRDYLRSVAQEALADGIVTDAERTELLAICDALGLTRDDVSDALAWAGRQRPSPNNRDSSAIVAGDRIVFTGEMKRDRDEWVASIVAAGLASGGVTKSTKLVVAADPDSLSGKAAKARQYGIPIVDEDTFVRLFQDYLASR